MEFHFRLQYRPDATEERQTAQTMYMQSFKTTFVGKWDLGSYHKIFVFAWRQVHMIMCRQISIVQTPTKAGKDFV